MTEVNKVDKKAKLDLLDIVKYQIITYCYFERIAISDAAAECYALLSIGGPVELNKFCNETSKNSLYASPQVVRNIIGQGELKELVVKSGKHRKKIKINPVMNVQSQGNILLDFKFVYCEPT